MPDSKSKLQSWRQFRFTKRYILLILVLWSGAVTGSLTWNILDIQNDIDTLAATQARAEFEKDILYREWAASHGGVYAPVSSTTSPNPYLIHIPERDVVFPSGETYTLINPAYMTRQVFDLGKIESGKLGRITSLDPIRPENKPDPWERDALLQFRAGADEVVTYEIINGKRFLRFMGPLVVKDNCLKCHGDGNNAVGDIRGGISLSIPMQPYLLFKRERLMPVIGGHVLLWLLGAAIVLVAARSILTREAQRLSAFRELRKKELALRVSELEYRSLVETAQELVWKCDVDGRFTYLNPAWEKTHGYKIDEMLGRSFGDFQSPEVFERDLVEFSRHLAGGFVKEYETTHLAKDGKTLTLLFSAIPLRNQDGDIVGTQGTAVDITDRKRAEEALRQAQKMEAVGKLTGGVAHDFNNLLQVINGGIELIFEDVTKGQPIDETLADVADAGNRAAELVNQLMIFSRRHAIQPKVLSLNKTIENFLKMLRRVIGEQVRLVWHPGRPDVIRADKSMIEQVLMNLCVNAKDAMPEGGTLSIETGRYYVDEDFCATHSWASPGEHVLLTVSDTGAGIDTSDLPHIFEPFYSTKGPGHGTGLGLATVYGIVKQHEGMINVYSEPGCGSVFRLYWPSVADTPLSGLASNMSLVKSGSETILLAEDEEIVRTMTTTILERAGYTVVAVDDGAKAVDYFRDNHESVDLVILDVVMSTMGGGPAYEKMQEISSDFRILFASGYTERTAHANFVLEKGTQLLQKPFTRNDLLNAVRDTLDSRYPVPAL